MCFPKLRPQLAARLVAVVLLGTLAALLSCATLALANGEAAVEAVFDRQEISLDENINMSIRILGAQEGVKRPPLLPSMEGFTSYYTGRASHFTFANGVSESTTEFNFVLIPKAAGRFTVPSIDVEVGDTIFRTEPIQITVMAAGGKVSKAQARPPQFPTSQFPAPHLAAPQPAVSSPYPAGEEEPDIFAKAWVNKNTAYPNEPVILTYSIYTRRDTQFEGFEEELVANGFWLEEFPMGRELERSVERIDGRKYLRADVKKVALFATAAGTLLVQPGSLRVAVEAPSQGSGVFDDFFNDPFFSGNLFKRRIPKILSTAPIQIAVLPFPDAGKPADFSGVVGQYRMSVKLDKRVVRVNEPLAVVIDIEGEGNLETLERPEIRVPKDFQVYDTDSRTQLAKQADRVFGKKTFEATLIPRKAGQFELPAIVLPYFDPYRKTYETLRGPSFSLEVKPGEAGERIDRLGRMGDREGFAKKLEKEVEDIYTIQLDLKSPRALSARRVVGTALALLNLLAGLCALALLIWRRAQQVLDRDHVLARRRRAPQRFRKDLGGLAKLAVKTGPAEDRKFYEELQRRFFHYLSDRLNLSRQGMTILQVDATLTKLGKEEALRNRVRGLADMCDQVRFADVQADGGRKRDCLKALEEILRELG